MKKFLLLGAAAMTLLAAAPAIAAPQNPGQPHFQHQQSGADRGRDNDRNDRGGWDNRGPSKQHKAQKFFYNGKYYNAFRDANWKAPKGYHRDWKRGQYMTTTYRAKAQPIHNPRAYHLRPAPQGYKWMRVQGNVYLVATRTGYVNDVVLNIFFN
jgi:Ni/Co efflux regulator RcnB